MADDESEKQTAMPSTEGESSNIVSEEPMIEIPLSSGSRIFKMKVSLADFCKLPIREIRIDSDETSLRNTNIAVMPLLNSSFCTQISSTASTTSGDKGACVVKESAEGVIRMTEMPLVIPKRSSLKLPTQIAINDQGKVRCDFPFDNPDLSQCEKKELNYSTLFSSKHRNDKGITRKMTVLPALTRDERKKIKIYVDENLQIEQHMIDQFRDKSDSTLGKELCEY